MPNTSDTFITTLKQAHLEWGTHRYTSSSDIVYGEGHLQIPFVDARNFQLYNNNQIGANVEYSCISSDGFLNYAILKTSGYSTAGNVYAKQFHGSGDLNKKD